MTVFNLSSEEKLLANPNWPQSGFLEKSLTFTGGTANTLGDHDGTADPYTLLTVTGLVEMSVVAKCTVSLVGSGATIELGTATTTAGILAQVADAEDIDAKDIWHDATVDASVELTSVMLRKLVSEDVILTIGSANITAGAITFYVRWAPISSDGNVVVA